MKKILFVCWGNICRSVMAEALCKLHGQEKVVAESAGTLIVLPYFPMDRRTIRVMREIGIDLSGRRPRNIRSVDVSSFDILVNMSADTAFLKKHPAFAGQIVKWDIVNPFMRPIGVYRKARDEIGEKVLDLIQ